MIRTRLFFALFFTAAALGGPALGAGSDTQGTADQSFFGVDAHEFSNFENLPFSAPFGTIRLWDLAGPKEVLWSAIQKTDENTFDWSGLDEYAQYAAANHMDILYVVDATPQWATSFQGSSDTCKYHVDNQQGSCYAPKDWSYFKNFMTAVASRYNSSQPQPECPVNNPQCHGVIKYYEIWNEPSVPKEWDPNQNYNGMNSMQLFVKLNEVAITTIRSIDPQAQILFGAVYQTGFMEDFWGKYKGPKNFDYVAYHDYPIGQGKLYYGAPENMQALVSQLESTMEEEGVNLPLRNTEGSWLSTKQQLTGPEMMDYAARYALLHFGMKSSGMIWYQWDSGAPLYDPSNQTLTAAGTGFADIQKWLLGAQLAPVASNNAEGNTGCFDSQGEFHDILDSQCTIVDFTVRKSNWGATYVVNMVRSDGSPAQAVWYVYTVYNSDCNTNPSDCYVDWTQTAPYQAPPQNNFNTYTDINGNTNCIASNKIVATATPVLLTHTALCENTD